jgi:hypothetical protein
MPNTDLYTKEKFDTGPLFDLIGEPSGYRSPSGLEVVVPEGVVGQWRWGNVYRLVFKRVGRDKTCWAVEYQVSSGDDGYHELEDFDEVEATMVVPKQVTTTVWVSA